MEEALSRAHLYGLLARLYRIEVDAELLNALREPELAAALTELGVNLEQVMAKGTNTMLLEGLAVEFARLFLVPSTARPPYESIQLGEGQLFGNATVSVQTFMEEAGLALPEGRSYLPDHLSIELEIMQHLCLKEAEGDPAAVSLQTRFLKEHLLQWAPAYLQGLAGYAEPGLYREIAGLTAAFLQSEGQR